MNILARTTEAEMVAVFLQTEITSDRFGSQILGLLADEQIERDIIDQPDITDTEENTYRAKLLGAFRGFGHNANIFNGFPNDVEWYRAHANRVDLEGIQYINYPYWVDLSGGSRYARDAAQRIRSNALPPNQASGFWTFATALAQGQVVPPLIVVGPPSGDTFVVLEGHVRLTAYLLHPFMPLKPVELLLGYSSRISEWDLY